jgi:hypothetical protein
VLTQNDIAKCETWFEDNGLPYFVESGHDAIQRALAPRRVWTWAGLIAGLAVAAGVVAGLTLESWTEAILAALTAASLALIARFVTVFRVARIARWAAGHSWTNRHLLVPLATRALPFLILFITFLFINTEVWMVASAMDARLLWTCVGIFAAIAVAFLQQPFRDEIDRVGTELEGERLVQTCAGTPVASAARELQDEPHLATEMAGIRLPLLQRRNLFLMLFITQAIQVVLLAVVVFVFFVVFGAVAIRPEVVEAWLGHAPTYVVAQLNLSRELLRVAVFLSAFAGLYFTVQAVIDETYRREFFSQVSHGLEQAVGVRKVYVALRAHLATEVGGVGRPGPLDSSA